MRRWTQVLAACGLGWMLSSACSQAVERPAVRHHVGAQVQLLLAESHGRCHLVTSPQYLPAQPHPTALAWPCQFHTDHQGKVRVLSEKSVQWLLIESTTDEATQLQAVRIQGTRVTLSPYHDRVAAKPPFQWDQAMFKGLFP